MRRAESLFEYERIRVAIDRWIRIKGSVTTSELQNLPALSRFGRRARSHWIWKILQDPAYVKDTNHGGRGSRVRFASVPKSRRAPDALSAE